MPAYVEEIEAALEEGVRLETLVAPEEFLVEDGKVTAVRCRRMTLGEFDGTGRRRASKADEGRVFPTDQVILAIGQRLEAAPLLGALDIALAPEGWIRTDPVSGQTALPWLFAGGDAVSGPSSVVAAIGAGEKAAVGIDRFLTGGEHAFWRDYHEVRTSYDPDADPVDYPRGEVAMIPVERRRANFEEVEKPWNEAMAVRQAQRCLRCDFGKTCAAKGA